MIKVTSQNFEAEVLNSGGLVLAEFYSDDCVPCKRMSPILAELEEELKNKLKLCKINVFAEPDLVEKYEIYAAPTFIFFKDGAEKQRRFGFTEKSKLIETAEGI